LFVELLHADHDHGLAREESRIVCAAV